MAQEPIPQPVVGPKPIVPPGETIPTGPVGSFTNGSNRTVPALTATSIGIGGAIKADGGGRAGVWASSNNVQAVYGVSQQFDAVVGESNSNVHAGVTGRNLTKGGQSGACGIYGTGGQYAGKFDGDVFINGKITYGDAMCHGTMTVAVDVVLAASASDCAEDFEIAAHTDVEPGTVMVLDDAGSLCESERAYDKKVAGVISGAGGLRPGLILGRDNASSNGQRAPIALVGKVYCKVDARSAPIEIGDLLTTSATKGHAMKAEDPMRSFGAVIGKALQRMLVGHTGLIPILVSRQ